MRVGIAVLDDQGMVHWAPFAANLADTGRNIARQMRMTAPPNLQLACATDGVHQVRRVSTLARHVTCMACVSAL